MPARRNPTILTLKALAPRQWASRAWGVAAFVFAMTLAIMGRSGQPYSVQIRAAADDVLAPIVSVLSAPAQGLRSAGAWASDLANLRSENMRLNAQVKELSAFQAEAASLKAENESLRALIRTAPEGAKSYIAARIVGDAGGSYIRSALISGGTGDGIVAGQAVVGPDGLVGRVTEAGAHSARVLLLTDINSRIPVIGEQSRERSIAAGGNSDALTLNYLPTGSKLAVGERILTSGDGGVFPPGIPVGVVTAIQGGNVTVQPVTDWSRLEYVNAVAYDF